MAHWQLCSYLVGWAQVGYERLERSEIVGSLLKLVETSLLTNIGGSLCTELKPGTNKSQENCSFAGISATDRIDYPSGMR